MVKQFNCSADCKPELHYMVNMYDNLVQIKHMVDQGLYFPINYARQYGKTTTLHALEQLLKGEYIVLSMDFQMFSAADFQTEKDFVETFSTEILESVQIQDSAEDTMYPDTFRHFKGLSDGTAPNHKLSILFRAVSRWCGFSDKGIVLLIDEVDSACKYPVFLDFLSQLRGYYIVRDKKPTFHSVVLASVYDLKNLKSKIGEEYQMNSPWNIAADFNIDLSLTEQGIDGMLQEYERDYATGMDTHEMSSLLYAYTSGYPYLVSRICKLLDEKVSISGPFQTKSSAWTKSGFLMALRILLEEDNPLFESLDNKLIDYPDLKQSLQELLLQGKMLEYIPSDLGVRMAVMFGFVKIKNSMITVANRIFETRLYNIFLAEHSRRSTSMPPAAEKNQFIHNGHLDMELVIQKFADFYREIFDGRKVQFLEDYGRCLFLLYIKPIINGTGNYYIEARTRTNRRTDVIIDYNGRQYIIELKIWHGQEYQKRGEKQLAEYLDSYQSKCGYLISFNFNQNKKTGIRRILIDGKSIMEAIV